MINLRIISKIIGSLLFVEAFFMLWCVAMAFYYDEDDQLAFLLALLITTASGFFFMMIGSKAENRLSRKDAYLLVTSVWVIFSFFGMFPFLFHGTITNISKAYFETMSGFSTTGASIFDDVEHLPHSMLFWRSLMQWIGGLGIVFFTIALLPSLVGGSMRVFAAEATGPIKAKMHPRLTTTAKWLWSIYLLLTVGCGLAFWCGGMNWFEAINFSMTTTATGGFSIYNDIGSFIRTPTIAYTAIIFQLLSGVNFTLLYMSIFKLRLSNLVRNAEFRFYMMLILVSTLIIMLSLLSLMGYDVERAFREALFHVVSCITTTGMFLDDTGLWPPFTWVILGVVMYIGGCAGSTSGGFKSIRAVMLLKVVRNNFRQILHPNAVLPVKIGDQTIPQSKIAALSAYFSLSVLMLLATIAIMVVCGIDIVNALLIALSCVSNVGPSLTTTIGPSMTWTAMPDYLLWILSLLMLMGRLEILTVIVLFTRAFWKEN